MAKTGTRSEFERYFEEYTHRLPHTSILEQFPMLLTEIIKVAREFRVLRVLDFSYEILLRMSNFYSLPLELHIETVRLSRELNPDGISRSDIEPRTSKSRGKSIGLRRFTYLKKILLENIGNLPLDSIDDIRWFASETGDSKLLREIEKRI